MLSFTKEMSETTFTFSFQGSGAALQLQKVAWIFQVKLIS